MKKTTYALLTITILLSVLLTACSAQEQPIEDNGGFITGINLDESTAGKTEYFSIDVAQDNDPIGIDFRGTLKKGELIVQITDSEGISVFERTVSEQQFKINEVVSLPAGKYQLAVAWSAATKGSYNVHWQPGQVDIPILTPLIFLPGVGMTLVGIIFIIYGVRRGGWKYCLLGAGFWTGTVVIKFVWAILLNSGIYQFVTKEIAGLPGQLLFSLYVGLLTGFTEVLITWLVLRYTKLGQVVWQRALAFSVGFGAFEALLLGLVGIIGMVTGFFIPDQIAVSDLRSLARANELIYDLAPILERFFTVWVHTLCNVLLFYGAIRKQGRWFWMSFIFKSAIDTAAGYAQISGQLESLAFLWLIEAIVAVFGIIGWWGVRRIQARYQFPLSETAAVEVEQSTI